MSSSQEKGSVEAVFIQTAWLEQRQDVCVMQPARVWCWYPCLPVSSFLQNTEKLVNNITSYLIEIIPRIYFDKEGAIQFAKFNSILQRFI